MNEVLPGLPPRYRVESSLGGGPGKRVHLARDTRLGRYVAVTEFAGGVGGRSIARLHEARAMARVGDHPHVVSIYDVIEGGSTAYIVSQYLAGGDLEQLLDARTDRALPTLQALRTAAQVCRALEHAHANDVTHCDLKPSNLFIDEHGDVFLGDFGFAEIAGAASGSIAGTPAYMAPERVQGAAPSPAVDLYSLGCLLYELVTGRPPFTGATPREVMLAHQTAAPLPPVERAPGLTPLLNDLILKLLEKDPGARPHSAADVRAALTGIIETVTTAGEAPATEAAAWRLAEAYRELDAAQPVESALVSREEELASLRDLLGRVGAGVPGVLLVTGEAGIGKSRLLREARALAEARGAVCLHGQGDSDAAYPLRPFVEALRPLAGRLSELRGEDAALLRRLLHLRRSEEVEQWTPVGAAQHHRLYLAVWNALVHFSSERPLALLIDDLHWADSASVDLFEHLALSLSRHTGELHLLLAAGFRPVARDSRVGFLAERLEGESHCYGVQPRPLDRAGIFDLLGELGVERPSDQVVHRVGEITRGNPLFVRQLVRHARREGLLEQRRGFTVATVLDLGAALPGSLRGVISEHARELGDELRELLTTASLLGTRFELARLAEVVERPRDQLASALDQAVLQRVLLDEGEVYRFAHPLIQEEFRQQAGPTRRHFLHLRIAERLEATEGQDAELEIAHHLVRAGGVADSAKQLRYAERAAEHALARFAWHEAADMLEEAIRTGEAGGGASVRALAELHRKAGFAYFRRLDPGPSLHHYDAAARGFREAGDSIGLARTLNERMRAVHWSGQIGFGDASDLEPLESALVELPAEERELRADIMNTLAESYWRVRDMARAEELGARALELAGEADADSLCAEISGNLGLVLFQRLRLDEALSIWRTGAVHARRAGDVVGVQHCSLRVLMALFSKGLLDEALETAEEVEPLVDLLQLPGERANLSSMQLALCTVRGDLERAERHGREAVEQVRRTSYPWAALNALPLLACARIQNDDVVGAQRALELLSDPEIQFEGARAFMDFVALQFRWIVDLYSGGPGAVDRPALAALPPLAPGDALDFATFTPLCVRVELAHALQDAGLAAGARKSLRVASDNGLVFASSWPFFVPRLLGVAALLEGDEAEAEASLRRAIEIARSLGAVAELGRSELDLAQLLAARNAPGDRERAHSLVKEATGELALCGAPAFCEEAGKLAAFLSRS